MLIVIEEVKVQLCQVNRELTTLELSIQDKDKQPDTLQKIDSEIATYTTRQKQAKRDKLKLINQDYQEGRVYPWLTGIRHPRCRLYTRPPGKPFKNDRSATSDSDPSTENPSTDSDSGKPGGAEALTSGSQGPHFPVPTGDDDPGGASRSHNTLPPRSTRQGTRRAW